MILTFVRENGYVNAKLIAHVFAHRYKSCSVIKQILQLIFHHLRAPLRFVVFRPFKFLSHVMALGSVFCVSD